MTTASTLHRLRSLLVLAFCLMALAAPMAAQASRGTVPVLMLSDIHFDPFHDTGKFKKLRSAPVSQWESILNAPASANEQASFMHLQQICGGRGVDTAWPLLVSSLHAEKQAVADPLFVTVGGDLLAHQFDCRFHTLAPHATPREGSEFAARTVAFVVQQLHHTYPHSSIYFTLGNNDSGCGDYREDVSSPFLAEDASSFSDVILDSHARQDVLHDFTSEGNYSVELPKPFEHTRLIAFQDIFQSTYFASCNSKAPTGKSTPAERQIAWLRAQLTAAREHHEKVWIMTHIPPGIDAYSTLRSGENVCAGAQPVMFLRDEALAKTLTSFADVIKLALFGHTHMDEMRLYRGAGGHAIPGKLVPSISPVNGNRPAFMVAAVNPSTATLVDYTVYDSKDAAGNTWSKEYRYSSTYDEPDYSAQSVEKLMQGFSSPGGESSHAAEYRREYSAGDKGFRALALGIVWPSYVCSIDSATKADFKQCVCAAKP